jgi:hypothetical protein
VALYVYAITREALIPESEAIDRTRTFATVAIDGVAAVYTRVADDDFSQESIDRRAADLEWLGAVGYRHQGVVAELMRMTPIVPLRAFTLFSGEEALAAYLSANRDALDRLLTRLAGKQEWTLRIEFEPQKWSQSIVSRVESLAALAAEAETASSGKAFLLRKKLEEEKKRASREAEERVVAEIERAVVDKLSCETVAETREQREGAFPQIDVLIHRDEESVLQELHAELARRYGDEGITLAITGPWPPYTFAALTA